MTDVSPAVHVGQGEFHVATGEETVITTVLGSCVAACLWDPEVRIGGMNHILLPDSGSDPLRSNLSAINAMELLVNGLLRKGATKMRLKAKLFGGAKMIAGLSDIGIRNAAMTQEFLEREAIPCLGTSLGGVQGRRIQFWPASGRVRQMMLGVSEVPPERPSPAPKPSSVANDFELF